MTPSRLPLFRTGILLLAMFCNVAFAQTTKPGDPITLNFNNAEIEAVARTIALISGMNVVVDPRVKGTITLVTEKPVSRSVAMAQFLSLILNRRVIW